MVRPAALVMLLAVASILAACSAEQPSGEVTAAGDPTTSAAGSAPVDDAQGTTQPAASTSFCGALGRVLDLGDEAESASPDGSTSATLTPAQQDELVRTILPAIVDLQAATPAELREPVDGLLELMTSLTLPVDDPGRSQVLIDLLAGGGVDHDTFQAFLTFANDSCTLDEDRVAALRQLLGAPADPEESCRAAGPDLPAIPDQDRLLTVDDVTSIDVFARNCPQIPNLGPNPSPAPHAPCGGALPAIDLSSGPGASYGIGFAKVVEVLAAPGAAAASDYVGTLEATTTSGCAPFTTTATDGTTSTTSDVEPIELTGIADRYAASTARLSMQASFGGNRGIPLDLEVAMAVVQHGDELLVLVTTGQQPVSADDLSDLTAAAVRRAGW